MTNHTRLRRLIVSASAALGALALAVGAPMAASAATIGSPSDPHTVTSYTFTVSGTGTYGNYVALAVCNATIGGVNGTDCDAASQVGGIPVDPSGNWSTSITVQDNFANVSLSGLPSHGGSTDCFVDLCQVQVSEYTEWFPTNPPVGTAGTLDLIF